MYWLQANEICMRLSLKRSGFDEVMCTKSYQTSHLGGEITGIEFIPDAVICEWYELIQNGK